MGWDKTERRERKFVWKKPFLQKTETHGNKLRRTVKEEEEEEKEFNFLSGGS